MIVEIVRQFVAFCPIAPIPFKQNNLSTKRVSRDVSSHLCQKRRHLAFESLESIIVRIFRFEVYVLIRYSDLTTEYQKLRAAVFTNIIGLQFNRNAICDICQPQTVWLSQNFIKRPLIILGFTKIFGRRASPWYWPQL